MRFIWHSALSLLLGFLGGVAAMKVELRSQARAVLPIIRAETVRANRFELVDSRKPGQVVAYWGQDWQRQQTLIAFLNETGKPSLRIGTERNQRPGMSNGSYSPFFELLGSDGKSRIQQRLDGSENPVLTMGDSRTEERLLLGHWLRGDVAGKGEDPWDKWSLVFRSPSNGLQDFADIGMTTPVDSKKSTGYVLLHNSEGHQIAQMPK